jgi:hypothetical protein
MDHTLATSPEAPGADSEASRGNKEYLLLVRSLIQQQQQEGVRNVLLLVVLLLAGVRAWEQIDQIKQYNFKPYPTLS